MHQGVWAPHDNNTQQGQQGQQTAVFLHWHFPIAILAEPVTDSGEDYSLFSFLAHSIHKHTHS